MPDRKPINVKAEVIDDNSFHPDRGYLIATIVAMVIGVALLIKPLLSLEIVCYVIGLLTIIIGIVNIYHGAKAQQNGGIGSVAVAGGIALIILGMFFILARRLLIAVFPIFIGIVVLIDSVFKLTAGIGLRNDGVGSGFVLSIVSIVMIVLSFIMILNPFGAASFLTRLLGILMIIDGAVNLWYLYVSREDPYSFLNVFRRR
jgi:uncharacterized membrane protein HdeD (DUF308 family)